MKLAAIRGAMAGCVGSLVLVAVLVLVPSSGEGVGEIDRSLERSGVVIVDAATTPSRPAAAHPNRARYRSSRS